MPSTLIFDLTYDSLISQLTEWGEPVYRADQIWKGLYQNFFSSADQFTNLPLPLRYLIREKFGFSGLSVVTELHSSDKQTIKTLFSLSDNQHIESVLMRYNKRRTICISTQVGCAMGCVFCATGQMGFHRHLTRGEIVAQVMYYARLLDLEGSSLTNVVVMGMGEPFHNYENTLSAIDLLNDPNGFNFGARRFTISTVGLVPAIRRFAEEKRQVNLAISLHAADDSLRTLMLPINKAYPIDELLSACRDYQLMTGRRVTFEWALINGVNDTPQEASLLAKKLKGLNCHVNAIPLNPSKGYLKQASTRERAEAFRDTLVKNGINCTIRLRRGIDIQAGCGQLAGE